MKCPNTGHFYPVLFAGGFLHQDVFNALRALGTSELLLEGAGYAALPLLPTAPTPTMSVALYGKSKGLNVAPGEQDSVAILLMIEESNKQLWKSAHAAAVAKPAYYRCGICDHYHAATWNGDCREDKNRLTLYDVNTRHGEHGWDEVDMPA